MNSATSWLADGAASKSRPSPSASGRNCCTVRPARDALASGRSAARRLRQVLRRCQWRVGRRRRGAGGHVRRPARGHLERSARLEARRHRRGRPCGQLHPRRRPVLRAFLRQWPGDPQPARRQGPRGQRRRRGRLPAQRRHPLHRRARHQELRGNAAGGADEDRPRHLRRAGGPPATRRSSPSPAAKS